MHEIQFSAIAGIALGHAQDRTAQTGCTVLLTPQGAPAGVWHGGGGCAARETQLLNPLAAAAGIHAVLFSGGSAFGLRAANGVMQYLSERGVGVDCGVIRVPLVCQSCIFDLHVGEVAYPDEAMAYRACQDAEKPRNAQGAVGAGIGATFDKLHGAPRPGGVGLYAVEVGKIQLGAVAVVNALGNVPDGAYDDPPEQNMFDQMPLAVPPQNTTLVAVVTNAKLDKTQCSRLAAMAHNGLVRAIEPVNLSMDGDTVYALSVGEAVADPDFLGTLAAKVVAAAIRRAVR